MSLKVIRYVIAVPGALAGLTAVFSITLHMAVKYKLDVDVPRKRLLFVSFVSVISSALFAMALVYCLTVQLISSLSVASIAMLLFVIATLGINPPLYSKVIQHEAGSPIGFRNGLRVAAIQTVILSVLFVLAIALTWLQYLMGRS